MNSQDLNILQNPQLADTIAKHQAMYAITPRAQFNADQAKMQALETENAELVQQLKNMNMARLELIKERDVSKRSNDVQIQATKEDAERIRELQEQHAKELNDKDLFIQELEARLSGAEQETVDKLKVLEEQHAKQMKDKNVEIQTLKTQLAASEEESTSNSMNLLEQYLKELAQRNLVIGNLETQLAAVSAAEQQIIDKLKELKGQHVKQMKDKNVEIQTLQDKLAAFQEQHAKELNDKDFVIQELKTHLPAAELQTVDKVKELTNENNRLSQVIQKLQEERIKAERRLRIASMFGPMLTEGLQKKLQVHQKTKEVVSQLYQGIPKEESCFPERRLKGFFKVQKTLRLEKKEKDVVPEPTTQLHTELGKLYMQLQEAKKPQEALMSQLAAKDKEIEYLMEQLETKDSEIQNLKEMIQGGDDLMKKRSLRIQWQSSKTVVKDNRNNNCYCYM
ncbi:hypothetical protein GCK72_015888 [Caenorhabditis remanei]|uniref:Uncharacterized protein n=1 Tax=Caenorhabditis remanei TaxID=31234 RepID=A0A6A5GXM2_CAERE|nr:hypothetical protein GCK72_015888 [Caenorhabditis remanei]KAF1759421.1 hypothetical protein GCK72_015888 [Caenorhabditis remanei]